MHGSAWKFVQLEHTRVLEQFVLLAKDLTPHAKLIFSELCISPSWQTHCHWPIYICLPKSHKSPIFDQQYFIFFVPYCAFVFNLRGRIVEKMQWHMCSSTHMIFVKTLMLPNKKHENCDKRKFATKVRRYCHPAKL